MNLTSGEGRDYRRYFVCVAQVEMTAPENCECVEEVFFDHATNILPVSKVSCIPYHTILCHTIPYHTIPYYAIPYHTIPYHIMPYHTIPYHPIPHHAIPYHTIPYHPIPYHAIPYNEYTASDMVQRRLIPPVGS